MSNDIILPDGITQKDKIKLEGHYGTHYIIDSFMMYGRTYYMLESEQYGDEANGVCIRYEDGKIKIIYDEYYDRETLMDYLHENPELS